MGARGRDDDDDDVGTSSMPKLIQYVLREFLQ
jgi:hypothetical protein